MCLMSVEIWTERIVKDEAGDVVRITKTMFCVCLATAGSFVHRGEENEEWQVFRSVLKVV